MMASEAATREIQVRKVDCVEESVSEGQRLRSSRSRLPSICSRVGYTSVQRTTCGEAHLISAEPCGCRRQSTVSRFKASRCLEYTLSETLLVTGFLFNFGDRRAPTTCGVACQTIVLKAFSCPTTTVESDTRTPAFVMHPNRIMF